MFAATGWPEVIGVGIIAGAVALVFIVGTICECVAECRKHKQEDKDD